ncbi:MAG: DNA repair protein RecO [Patescibacteria group bacterium]|nr:DNA repair protein RecO [Patescibacteria group bacterium]
MFTRYRTKAIILDDKQVGEADRIFTFYTKDFGKITAIGRSIRKGKSKLKMNTQLFSFSEIEFIQGRKSNTLTDAVLLSSFSKTKNNLAKLSLFYRIAETTLSFIKEQEKDENIFSLLLKTFQEVEEKNLSKEKLKIMWCAYSFRLLYFLGYKVYTKECMICEEKIEKECYFSPEGKGVVCSKCYSKNPIGIYIDDIKKVFLKNPNRCIKITRSYINNI